MKKHIFKMLSKLIPKSCQFFIFPPKME